MRSLGIKQLGDDPWEGIPRRYPSGTRLFGKVTNLSPTTAHSSKRNRASKASSTCRKWTGRTRTLHRRRLFSWATKSKSAVLEIDEDRRRISLGMKQCGRTRGRLQPQLQEGRQAARRNQVDYRLRRLHRSAWAASTVWFTCRICRGAKPAKKPARKYKKGDEVEAIVLGIDVEKGTYFSLGTLSSIWRPRFRQLRCNERQGFYRRRRGQDGRREGVQWLRCRRKSKATRVLRKSPKTAWKMLATC